MKLLNCDTKGGSAAPQICTVIAAADDSSTNDVPSTSTVLPPLAVAETDIEEPTSTSQAASPSPHEDEPTSPTTTPVVQQEEEDEAVQFQRKLDNVETLLDIIRQYSDRDVFPAPDMVATIVEMGFEEKSVREALVATRNNQSAAVTRLVLSLREVEIERYIFSSANGCSAIGAKV